jgi:SAM-dependent methyltransferase
LGLTFDAAVCGFNSLNYLSDPDELEAVLRVVADHLRPGGVFVFDTVTDLGMRLSSGVYMHVETDGARFALRRTYDAARRRQEVEALMPAGVEVHRRVPIDHEDVVRATQGTELRLDDYFSSAVMPAWLSTATYCFFVLTRYG